jgi:hypothetical protein
VINQFLVTTNGEETLMMRPVPQRLSKAETLTLVAWLAVMAQLSRVEIDDAMSEVENT